MTILTEKEYFYGNSKTTGQIIADNNFANMTDIYAYYEERIGNILYEIMEAKIAL